MAFGAVKPLSQPRKLFNISGEQTSSNQQAIAVPYFAGSAKIALTWISKPYNVTVKKVTSSSGGKAGSKAGSGAPAQKKYRGDICGFACVCPDDFPVDSLLYVLVNDEVAYTGPLNRVAGQHYAAFSLLKYCQDCRIWWGTKDSPFDDHILQARNVALGGGGNPSDKSTYPIDPSGGGTVLDADYVAGLTDPRSGHYDTHPAYRNFCRFTFKQFHLGSTKNMPNMEVIIKRGCGFFSGSIAAADEGVNPMGPAFEIYTDDLFGAGMPVTRLDEPSFQAAKVANDNSGMKLAPVYRDARSLRSAIAEYVQYFNGFFRTEGNKLLAGVYLTGSFDQSGIPTFGDDDLAGEPSIKPGTFDDTLNYFALVFTNRAHWFYSDDVPARYSDTPNFQIVGERRPEWVQRPFIIDEAIGQRYITAYGMMRALEPQSGSAPFKRERVAAIKPGSLLKLNASSYSQTFLLRAKKVKRPGGKGGVSQISVQRETGTWPALYQQPGNPKPTDFLIDLGAIPYQRVLELPAGLRNHLNAIQVGILAMRSNATAIGFNVHLSIDNVDYEKIAVEDHFAVMGKLVGAYSGATPDLDEATGFVADLFGFDQEHILPQSDQARDDNTLLCIIDNEFFSLGDSVAIGGHPGRFRFYSRRKLYGSAKVAHADGATCWFVFRAELLAIENKNFVAGATRYFKFQPFTEQMDYDVAAVAAVPFNFANVPAFSTVDGLALTTAAKVAEGKTPFITIIAVWDAAADENIVAFELNYQKDGETNWQSVTTANKVVDFAVDPATLYNVRVRAIDNLGPGDWCATQQILSGQLSDFEVTHLELDGQANDLTFTGRIAKLRWGIDSIDSSQEIGMETNGIQAGEEDPLFKDYFLELFDPTTNALLWDRPGLQAPRYDLDVVEAVGLKRSIVAQVTKRSTVQNLVTRPNRITISNPIPAKALNLVGTPNGRSCDLDWDSSNDTDRAGAIVGRSETAGWAPGDVGVAIEYFDPGLVSKCNIPQDENTTYYYRVAEYDAFFSKPLSAADIVTLNFSDEVGVKTGTFIPTLGAPSIDPPSKTFSAAFDVSVLADAGQTVRYTLDGTEVISTSLEWPKAGSPAAYTTIHIGTGADVTLRVRGYLADGTPTKERTVNYSYVTAGAGGGTCATPTLSYTGKLGKPTAPIVVTLSCATAGVTIRKSINGVAFSDYTVPFNLASGSSVEYYALKAVLNDSAHDTFENTPPDPGGGGGNF